MIKQFAATPIAILWLLTGTMYADAGPPLTPAQEADGAETLDIARRLANYGEARGDALALLTAARMIASVPGNVMDYGPKNGAIAERQNRMDPARILAKARELATDDTLVAAMSDQIQAAAVSARDTCRWEYYCYFHGECRYTYDCW